MKKSNYTKVLFCAVGLSVCGTTAWADTILANGNFTDGKAHWKGDGKDASSADIADISASLANQDKVNGMAVELKPTRWSVVSQVFNTRETTLIFSMTYKTTSDFALGGGGFTGDIKSILEGFVGFPLKGQQIKSEPGSALVIISDPSQNEVMYSFARLPSRSVDAQTASTGFKDLMAHEEKTLYVAFPPGTGTITFSNISLKKPDAAAQSDNPFQH